MSRALGDRRSVVQASSQTIDTSASLIPGCSTIWLLTSLSTPAANGHQPDVSSNSTLATPSSTWTERTRPMSRTEMPFSRQQGS
jgi:hypothetical protein